MKVALVEDDEAIACLLRYNFEVSGWIVELFQTGHSALEGLHCAKPDLVVLDWNLPGLSGIELLRRLRATPHTRTLPVVMLTGRCEPADRTRALESGVDAFFSKPFSVSVLVDDITRLLQCRIAATHGHASPPMETCPTGPAR